MDHTTPTITVAPSPVHNVYGLAPGDTTTGYLRLYLSLAGPTSCLAYRYLLEATGWGEHTAVVELATMTGDLGLGRKLGTVNRTLERMGRFGLLLPGDQPGHALVPTALRPLSANQLNKLRPELQRIERLYRTGHPAALPHPAH